MNLKKSEIKQSKNKLIEEEREKKEKGKERARERLGACETHRRQRPSVGCAREKLKKEWHMRERKKGREMKERVKESERE
jgi:hypothetical protein